MSHGKHTYKSKKNLGGLVLRESGTGNAARAGEKPWEHSGPQDHSAGSEGLGYQSHRAKRKAQKNEKQKHLF